MLMANTHAATFGKPECMELSQANFKVCLQKDSRLSGDKINNYWRSGQEDIEFRPSRLRIYFNAKQVYKADLMPLSKIALDTFPNRSKQYIYISEDYTASAGSYSGPATTIISVNSLGVSFEMDTSGNEFLLASTGKSEWKEVQNGFLTVRCHSDYQDTISIDEPRFVTEYTRYWPTRTGWISRMTSKQGYWENNYDPNDPNDSTFNTENFPAPDEASIIAF